MIEGGVICDLRISMEHRQLINAKITAMRHKLVFHNMHI
jgi:hypothetical protein